MSFVKSIRSQNGSNIIHRIGNYFVEKICPMFVFQCSRLIYTPAPTIPLSFSRWFLAATLTPNPPPTHPRRPSNRTPATGRWQSAPVSPHIIVNTSSIPSKFQYYISTEITKKINVISSLKNALLKFNNMVSDEFLLVTESTTGLYPSLADLATSITLVTEFSDEKQFRCKINVCQPPHAPVLPSRAHC